MYLVLEEWAYLLICVVVIAATPAFLKLNWYAKMQDHPDDLAAAAPSMLHAPVPSAVRAKI